MITITCQDCKKDRLVKTNGMLKSTYEKTTPRCHKCGANKAKEKISKGWFKKGHISWHKGKKLLFISGEKSCNWKGNKVGYHALHDWVKKNLGKARDGKCKFCNSIKNLEWANKSLKYNRSLDDWMILCKKHHIRFDRKHGWGKATKKYNL